MGQPIFDPLADPPPLALTDRTAKAPPNQLATFRFPGDRRRQDANVWFAGGPQTHPIRKGNEVMYLVDGAKTFAEMARAIRSATDPTSHFIYVLGWTMFLDFPFAEDGATFGQLLRAASEERGIQVRVMLWGPMGFPKAVLVPNYGQNESVVREVNGMTNGQAILDGRTLGAGSHHQKVLVVNGAGGLSSFCGGVDVNPDRVFPLGVNGVGQLGGPMHDVHCRIRGPAAFDVLQTFIDRWSDYARAYAVVEKAPLLGGRVSLDAQPKPGRLNAQISRTFGNPHAHYMAGPPNATESQLSPYSFAAHGETTARTGFLRAIAAARRFIYIEDQYLVNPEASAALAKAVKNLSHITILIPHSDISDLPRVWELRKKFIDPLRQAGGEKVRIFVKSPFGPNAAHSYVHAKTWVFDDQFAIIGSANVGRRSWTNDSEIGVGVYDESTNEHASYTFAHRLRVQLWAEHLNMNTPAGVAQLADGVAAAAHWLLPGTNVAKYDENSGHDQGASSHLPVDYIDPDGT
jgi:phosphatidylserine/phosphatidylglycerophosphate/cardiolipin synthase-like enzyme